MENTAKPDRRHRSNSVSSIESTTSEQGPTTTKMVARKTQYNPLFASMLNTNTLRNCNEVQAMMTQCLQHKYKNQDDVSFVCHTAEKYMSKCGNGGQA